MPETTTEAKSPNIPARQLVLHTMLSLLVSVAVFVVVSWMVIIPQLARQEVRIRALENQVAEMSEAQEEAEAAAAPAAPAAAFLTNPHQSSRSEVYIRTETRCRPISARSRKPRPFTSRANSRSSATLSRIAACPPTSSYTERRTRMYWPLAMATRERGSLIIRSG